jgi:hypothetical protein
MVEVQGEGTRSGTSRVAVLVLALLAGAGAALAGMPAAFARVHHDLGRTGVLLRALEETRPAPRLLVFGNSVAMCGVDAGALRRELGLDGARAFNLSSTGQTLAEGFLYYQEIPAGTETLVYVLSPTQLEADVAFNAHVPNAFRMHGFRPSPETLATLEQAFSPAAALALAAPEPSQRFEARWVLRQTIDVQVRRLVRSDLDLERGATDLEFPAHYRTRIPAEKLAGEIRKGLQARPPGPLRPSPGHERLLREIAERARRDGRRLLLVLPPIHPRLLAGFGGAFAPSLRTAFRELESQGVRVLDTTTLLGEDEFIDSMHPTPEGAERLTARIAEALRQG